MKFLMKLHIVMVEPEIPQNTGNISRTCRIPMLPTLRSLNLSNSVAIVAYEILRQKDFEDLQEVSSYFD